MTDAGKAMDAEGRTPVVIIGGGPVGLSTALGLAHHGVRSLVVEQAPASKTESRTLNLWSRVLETFREWGVSDELFDHGTFLDRLEPLAAETGKRLFTFRFSMLSRVTPMAGVLMIPQNRTEDVLRAAVDREPACGLVEGRCTAVEQDEDGVTVEVETADGPRRIRADYCVGADGAHSTVRREIGVALEGTTYPQRMVLSDERISEDTEGRLRFALTKPGFNVALKFGDRQWRIMSSIPTGMSDEDAEKPSAVDERVRNLFGDRQHETEWISTFTVHRRIAENYRVGRVLLAGDAAHLISPVGGQGMNSGILDAENLCWKLAAALRGEADDALLDSYHDERHWVMSAKISQNADTATEAEFKQPPLMKQLMVRLVGAVVAVPGVRTKIARNLSLLELRYPASPELVGTHSLVGHRISDPVTTGNVRLSDRLKGMMVLYVNGATEQPVAGATVLTLPKAPSSWRLRQPAAVIVRPDRHVGAVLIRPSTSDIEAALNSVLGVGTRGMCSTRSLEKTAES